MSDPLTRRPPRLYSPPVTIDDITHDRIVPAATLIALVTIALSLVLAFRRLRLPAPAAARAAAPVEVQLFRLSYAVAFENGRLEPDARSPRRRNLRTSSGRLLPWRTPEGSEDPAPEDPLVVLSAGGRIIMSRNRATRRLAVHEADIARLHGLGRRGRGLILFPLLLAALAFAAVTHRALRDFLPRNAAASAPDLWLSVVVASALFALAELIALAIGIGTISAILRRVRRAQLRHRYEQGLRALLDPPAAA